jgi:hypothetical protein
MATMTVQPRPTAAERADGEVTVEVDDARLLFVQGEQTSSLAFRLDQLDACDDTGAELVLRFEENDGIAKVAVLTANGMDVERFHILTFT